MPQGVSVRVRPRAFFVRRFPCPLSVFPIRFSSFPVNQQFWREPQLPFVESRRAWQSRACYRPHTHPVLSIGAVDAGRSRLQVEGRAEQLLEAGDVVVIPAQRVHACNPEPDSAWSYQMLYLDADWVAGLENEGFATPAGARPGRPVHFRDPACYRQFCAVNALLFDAAVPAELKEEALIDFAGSLLLDAAPEDGAVPAWVPALAERLRRDCAQALSLAQLAAEAGVSRYHLIRVFREVSGLTPHAFQIDCRINEARVRLADGVPLAELALELGFSDQSHFQRAFRERVSVTPGDYQRQMRR